MNFTCKSQMHKAHCDIEVPDYLSSVVRQINKAKTSTDRPGPNYITAKTEEP